MILGEYVEYWYMTYKYPKHQQSTAQIALNSIYTHIQPSALGRINLESVRVQDVQQFLTKLLLNGNKCPIRNIDTYGKPLSHWTVNKIRQMLIAAFNQAIREGLIHVNCAAETEPIPIPYNTASVFSIEHQRKFLNATKNHRFYVAYVLYFYLGCRRAEILGLSWNNIHWKENYIFINQTLVVENGLPVLKKNHTKTPRSIRAIPIPKDIKFLLRELQKRQQSEKRSIINWNNPENLVFTNKDGSLHDPRNFSRNFKNMIKRLGFPVNLHLHSTRHTWATNMMQCGIPLSDIQAIGGWARPDVLLNIYAHSVQKSHKRAMNKFYKSLQD